MSSSWPPGTEILDLGEHVVTGVFSPDGRYLAVIAWTATVDTLEIYDLTTGRLVSTREFPTGGPFSLAFDPHSRWLAGGMVDGVVWVLDLKAIAAGRSQEDAMVFDQAAHVGGVVGLDVSGDGVVSSAARGESVVRLWDIATGERLLELSADGGPAAYPIARFSPDDSHLMYLDGTLIRRLRPRHRRPDRARERSVDSGLTADECREYLGPSSCT